MAVNADLVRPPRIPKLTYRNAHPTDSAASSSPNTPTDARSIDSFAVPRPSTSTTDSAEPSSRSRISSSSSASSLASSNDSASKASKAAKKKKNGMLSFLTVKEPSQVALEQFAKSQHDQATTKSPLNTIGLQNISTQKLPSNVPKVNSKWDGIPDAVKSARHSPSSSRTSSMSSHGGRPMQVSNPALMSSAFSVTSHVSRGAPPSLASDIDLSERKDPISLATPPLNLAPRSAPPEKTSFFPSESSIMSGALPTTPTHPWSPPPAPSPSRVGAQGALPFPEATPVEPVDKLVHTKADAILKKLRGDRGLLSGKAKEVKLNGEKDDQDTVPDTHNFLFENQSPAGHSRLSTDSASSSSSSSLNIDVSTPLPISQAQLADRPRTSSGSFPRPRPLRSTSYKSTSSALSTLYEESTTGTETITEESRTPMTTIPSRRSFDAVSVADSVANSVAPSTMSASWYRSSKDRLGLGSRISKSEDLPWETEPEPAGAATHSYRGGLESSATTFPGSR
ncbi:hypothetical protein P280DRAFT_523184 [Massarina eburnea CBS 473.64]|uniref:Uncharacterized protein n=1 Tax=Massarina eburnea CBS 473.64 TaxID=1395130 RepID=A0A6A6RME6_9PLEO|nr:hypothetical protein P280DRAFT_523184 [Massarina eburnea CBS 473.64]